MDIQLRTEHVSGSPQPRRVQVEGVDEVGLVIATTSTVTGHSVSTVLFESSGECRLYLSNRLKAV